VIGKGPSARSIRLSLSPFTLIGATTRAGQLTSPLRDRFGVISRLEFYTTEELLEIVMRAARILKVELTLDGAEEIAKRSRGTPRVANRLLKRVRDFAQYWGSNLIDLQVASNALDKLEVDKIGLDGLDKKILMAIIHTFDGGPVGLETLAATVGEEAETLEDVVEPFLLQKGFLQRTPRGRTVTPQVYSHFGLTMPSTSQSGLFLENN
jgi:Holliday junction DNA helicase RuvB